MTVLDSFDFALSEAGCFCTLVDSTLVFGDTFVVSTLVFAASDDGLPV
jgi:hypothetical protein